MISRSLSNEDEVMTSLDGIHDVGTFVQITELHDMGDQMRMIIQGHRRYMYVCAYIIIPAVLDTVASAIIVALHDQSVVKYTWIECRPFKAACFLRNDFECLCFCDLCVLQN